MTSTAVMLAENEVATLLNDLETLKSVVQQIEVTVNSTIPTALSGMLPLPWLIQALGAREYKS